MRSLRRSDLPRWVVLTGTILAVEAVLAAALVVPRLAPLMGLAVLAAGAVAVVARPALGVIAAAVLGLSVLPATLLTVTLGPVEVRGHELLVAGLVVLAGLAPRARSGGGAPAGFVCALLVALTLSSVLAAEAGRVSASDAWAWGRVFVPLALLFALPRLFPQRPAMERLLGWAVAVAVVTGLVAVVLAVAPELASLIPGGEDSIDSGGIYGAEGQRVRLPGAALAYALLPYAIVRLVQAAPPRRWIWGPAIVVMVACVALTLNRNMWLGLVFGLGLLLAFGGAALRRRLVVGGLVIAAAGAAAILALGTESGASGPLSTVVERGGTLVDPRAVLLENSLKDRADETERAWEAVGRAPLIGIGAGTDFGVYYYEEESGGNYTRTPQLFLHNQYLYVLLAAGAVGLLAFLGFLVAVVRIGLRSRDDAQVVALTAGLAMVALSAIVMISVANAAYAFVLALLAAGIVVLGRTPGPPPPADG